MTTGELASNSGNVVKEPGDELKDLLNDMLVTARERFGDQIALSDDSLVEIAVPYVFHDEFRGHTGGEIMFVKFRNGIHDPRDGIMALVSQPTAIANPAKYELGVMVKPNGEASRYSIQYGLLPDGTTTEEIPPRTALLDRGLFDSIEQEELSASNVATQQWIAKEWLDAEIDERALKDISSFLAEKQLDEKLFGTEPNGVKPTSFLGKMAMSMMKWLTEK